MIETIRTCDVTGKKHPGWAIVRISDGREVAHFTDVTSLKNDEDCRTLFDAAWLAASENEDEEE